VPETALETVFKLLPSQKNPTIAPLTNPQRDPVAEKWLSVTTVMTRLELTRLAPQLLKARASAITQKALERVIS
jgi:ATP phosphoribosyltransferase